MPTDALKVRTTVPQGVVIAGQPFTLTTTVTNPYDQPIEIISYGYQVPYQVQWIHEANFNQEFAKRSAYPWFRRLLAASIWNTTAMPPGNPFFYGNVAPPGQPATPIQTVAPGESQGYSFKAMMPQWLFITGGQLSFQGVITYRRDGQPHTSTFEIGFPFRPPLRSISLGALIGAVLGTAAKMLKENGPAVLQQKPSEVITATALAVILATIAVVYSSRRSNESQPVLTVEDVWGGMILGFLIGYLGNEFFQTIVPIQATPGG
jgi:hypothetical protein